MFYKKDRTIQSTLFSTYAIILFISFIVFSLFFINWQAHKIKNETFVSVEQITHNLSASVDREIQMLDTVSMNVAYSNLVKERFSTYVDYHVSSSDLNSKEDRKYNYTNNIKILGDLLTAIIGPNRPVDQVNIYAMNGNVFSSGLNNSMRIENITEKTWYSEVINAKGNKIITQNTSDEYLSKYFSSPDGKAFVSLYRVYFNTLNVPQGIIEVKKNFKQVFKDLLHYQPTFDENIFVFNQNGEVVFPILKQDASIDYYFDILHKSNYTSPIFQIENPYSRKNEFIKFIRSNYTGLTTVIVIQKNKLFTSLNAFITTIALASIFILIGASVLAFLAAKFITTPLHNIYKKIRKFDFETLSEDITTDISTNIIEFKTLNQAFQKMQIKLKASLATQLLIQNQEMQSKMLALQSQMNPHFLYNSLSTIQAMAAENMDKEIIVMCQTISKLLRYISSDKESLVSLKDELNHTLDYLKCMEIRYEGDLFYTINIPDELLEIKLPKLSLQPIVENSVKFVSNTNPPWQIHITGFIDGNAWKVSVLDTGPGFSQEKLLDIGQKIDHVNATNLLPSLELNGMGLMNIYIRFKILYPNDIIFKLDNVHPHGAHVTLGGPL
ncbi:sensor histidine kinase [Cellulosilyticum sp. I15G10I2]|uniref:sensor histidine kinase n=1 Tax=Cellulosilyticum sp. I15G10I2 TaxID=1892843 RepID=UPI00085C8F07|nr:histidine kinase [Cellulosilyticum sp. I15G10I2]